MQIDLLPNNLVLFDGVCKFCNASINFIIRHDANTVFYFATVQSKTGRDALTHFGIDPDNPTTFLLIKNAHVYTKSNAALEIAKHLAPPWSYLRAFRIFPLILRDAAYTLVAKNRYRILGKHDVCVIPHPEVKARFLD